MQENSDLGYRLKRVRLELGYAQKGIAEAVGGKLRSWQDYESGKKIPGSKVITGLALLGVNANWVLTGDGPMMLSEFQQHVREPTATYQTASWDKDLMCQVIEAVEESLDILDRDLDPKDKAELILSLYDLHAEAGAKPNQGTILKLVKSAG